MASQVFLPIHFNPKIEIKMAKLWQDAGSEMVLKNPSHTRIGLVEFFQIVSSQKHGLSFKGLSENSKGSCFRAKAGMATRDERAYPHGSASEEQRRQTGLCAKTLRAARLLPLARVGSALAARCGPSVRTGLKLPGK